MEFSVMVAELAYMSVEEVQGLKRMPKNALEEVQEKLAAWNLSYKPVSDGRTFRNDVLW